MSGIMELALAALLLAALLLFAFHQLVVELAADWRRNEEPLLDIPGAALAQNPLGRVAKPWYVRLDEKWAAWRAARGAVRVGRKTSAGKEKDRRAARLTR